jgi:acyl-CoA reductase LuxC
LIAGGTVAVAHVVPGEVVRDQTVEHSLRDGTTFTTPALDLDRLVWPRTEVLPAAEVPIAEVIEVLAATGDRLRGDSGNVLADVLESSASASPYERRLLANSYEDLWRIFDPDAMRRMVEGELGSMSVLDGWRPAAGTHGRAGAVRAFPARLVHVLAGNSPGVAAMTIIRGALTKGVHLLKMPSNDLLTAPALLQALAFAAPGHPVTRSFSAVYWPGGDTRVESVLFRPQALLW